MIELLPDRFDAQGRPLDRSSATTTPPRSWHTRRGDFEYRSPRGLGLLQGEWGIAGTDGEAVERIVRDVTGVLEGRGSWMGLIGGLLSGELLGGGDGDEDENGVVSDGDRGGRHGKHTRGKRERGRKDNGDGGGGGGGRSRRRVRGEDEDDEYVYGGRSGSGRTRQRERERDDDGYDDDDDYHDYYRGADDDYYEDRKRRSRRTKEYPWERRREEEYVR